MIFLNMKRRFGLAYQDARLDKLQGNLEDKAVLEETKYLLSKDPDFSDAAMSIVPYEEVDTLFILVKGYTYIVNENKIKYLGGEEFYQMPEAKITLTTKKVLTTQTIEAKVTQKDELGINLEESKWILTRNSNALGINNSSLYEGEFSGTFVAEEENLAIHVEEIGQYYLHVLTVNQNGVKKETISEKITVVDVIYTPVATLTYRNSEQTYIITEDGLYLLEVWGAQGGSASFTLNSATKSAVGRTGSICQRISGFS